MKDFLTRFRIRFKLVTRIRHTDQQKAWSEPQWLVCELCLIWYAATLLTEDRDRFLLNDPLAMLMWPHLKELVDSHIFLISVLERLTTDISGNQWRCVFVWRLCHCFRALRRTCWRMSRTAIWSGIPAPGSTTDSTTYSAPYRPLAAWSTQTTLVSPHKTHTTHLTCAKIHITIHLKHTDVRKFGIIKILYCF